MTPHRKHKKISHDVGRKQYGKKPGMKHCKDVSNYYTNYAFINSSDVKDWYEGKSVQANKAKPLF